MWNIILCDIYDYPLGTLTDGTAYAAQGSLRELRLTAYTITSGCRIIFGGLSTTAKKQKALLPYITSPRLFKLASYTREAHF